MTCCSWIPLLTLSLCPAGTNSYVLFTLDKLIIKLVRQLQALESDAQAQKLADLHAYECSRATTFDDAVYAANAHVLLGDEACYRIEAIPGDDAKLTVQMMDPDKTEVLPGEPTDCSFWPCYKVNGLPGDPTSLFFWPGPVFVLKSQGVVLGHIL